MSEEGRGIPRQALVGETSLLLCSARQALVLVGVGTGQADTIISSRCLIRTERSRIGPCLRKAAVF